MRPLVYHNQNNALQLLKASRSLQAGCNHHIARLEQCLQAIKTRCAKTQQLINSLRTRLEDETSAPVIKDNKNKM